MRAMRAMAREAVRSVVAGSEKYRAVRIPAVYSRVGMSSGCFTGLSESDL